MFLPDTRKEPSVGEINPKLIEELKMNPPGKHITELLESIDKTLKEVLAELKKP